MKILIAITVIIILLLLYKVRIIYSFKLKNFDFSAKITLKTPFSREIFNTEKPKKKKTIEKKGNKPKKKIDLETVLELKEPLTIVIARISRAIKKHCNIANLSIFVKTALDDPMENGIAFGVLNGVFNVGKAILMDKCKVKDIDLNITSDFESEEGLIFESFGTLKIRPLVLAVMLIFNFKLIKAIKDILTILKREDIENG